MALLLSFYRGETVEAALLGTSNLQLAGLPCFEQHGHSEQLCHKGNDTAGGPGSRRRSEAWMWHAAGEALGSASVGALSGLSEGAQRGLSPERGRPRDTRAAVLFLGWLGSGAFPWVCSPGYVTRGGRMRTWGCPTHRCGKPRQRALKTGF